MQGTRATTAAPLSTASSSSPAAASVRAVPSVATRPKPSPASAAATGTSAGLSSSCTDRKAVPAVGSGRPAARSALAKAVGRSAALAITSPVERISGPSTGSLPGKRAKGSTAALTLTCFGAARAARSSAARFEPAMSRQAASTRFTPIALLAKGTARVRLEDEHLALGDRELDVEQPDDAERGPEPADDRVDLGRDGRGQRRRRQDAGRVARVDARLLDVLHRRRHVDALAVAEGVDVDLDRVLDEAVD